MKTTWLTFQLDPAAPSLGDLAAWLATAAAAWVPGSAPLEALINHQDLKTFITTRALDVPMTTHGQARFKLQSPAQ